MARIAPAIRRTDYAPRDPALHRRRSRRGLRRGLAIAAALAVAAGVAARATGLPGRSTRGSAAAAASAPRTVRATAALPRPTTPAPPPALGGGWLARHPGPDLGLHAVSAVLVDAGSRQVLWTQDAHAALAPASLTKLVTVMVAADLAPLDRELTVPPEAAQVESDSTLMGLSPGESVSVRELLYGIFLVSGNDAAETLARGLVERDRFVQLMNAKAAELGMRDTHFTNPSGLDDPAQRSSAYDLAIAAVTIVNRYPDLLALAGAKDEVIPETATHKAFFLHSLIRLVSTYPGATGLKTGYTDDAGYCLAGTAARGGRRLVAVLLHDDTQLTADATRLLDYGFGAAR